MSAHCCGHHHEDPGGDPLRLVRIEKPELAEVKDTFDRSVMPELGPTPKFTPPAVVRRKLSNGLEVLIAERHELPILSLDYWDPEDAESVRRIYRRQRQLGHHPYVATHLLDRIIPEPPA